ncbi:MAG: ATP-binding cassette domain-containing protein [Gammaproteobacteria bacterium]|nr:ATP-binding cassette domain-containing protein [Gammaproteobacteria bacterium]
MPPDTHGASQEPAEPCVALKQVGKRFGSNWVLRGVDVSFPAGAVTAIVGESGSGKTTLLQLVNGMRRADEGRVEVLGEPVPERYVEAFRRRIGYAVQGARLFPHMTVARNVTLLARLEGWPEERRQRRLHELLSAMGLEADIADRYPHQISGGQQHRVGLCRAMMLHPDMLLLDEPFSAIDPINRADIYPVFEALHEREPISTLLVTHDMAEARRLADYLVIVGDGGVIQAGAREAVLEAPANATVTRLLEAGA